MTRYRVLSVRLSLLPHHYLVSINAPDHHVIGEVYVPAEGEPTIRSGIDINNRNKQVILDLAIAAVACDALGGNVKDIVV